MWRFQSVVEKPRSWSGASTDRLRTYKALREFRLECLWRLHQELDLRLIHISNSIPVTLPTWSGPAFPQVGKSHSPSMHVGNQISKNINEHANLYQLSVNVFFKRYLKLEIRFEIYIKCKSKRKRKKREGANPCAIS